MSKKLVKKTSKEESKQKNDTEIKVIENNPIDGSFNNYLVLSFKGTNIDNVIMNTLRRTIMELVPTYAFDKSDINITKNTSVYNNDQMILRISYFPVIGIENNKDNIKRSAELEYEASLSKFEKKIEDLTILEQKEIAEKAEKSQNLIMSVEAKNLSNNILNVTTNSPYVKFYYKSKAIESPYKKELLIIKLKAGEEFICNATSSIGIGLKNSNFMPNTVCVFSEPNENVPYYLFNIESNSQMLEKDIILRACSIIDIKLNNLLSVMTTKISEYKSEKIIDEYTFEKQKELTESESVTESAIRNSSENALEQHRIKGLIKIENESHTYGNLISHIMQDHPAIIFAGYKIDHPLIKELTIGYKTDGTDIIDILTEVITKIRDIFNNIYVKIDALVI